MRKIITLLISLGLLGSIFHEANACTFASRKCEMTLAEHPADYISIRYYYLTTSVTVGGVDQIDYVFETKSSGSNPVIGWSHATDTVMALVNQAGQVICQNDDIASPSNYFSKLEIGQSSGPFACRIPSDGVYTLVIRSYSNGSGGESTLEVTSDPSGSPQTTSESILSGGKEWTKGSNTNESFQAANISGKGDFGIDTVIMLRGRQTPFSSPEDMRFDDDGGINLSPKVVTINDTTSVIVGQYSSFAAVLVSPPDHKVNIYHNDIAYSAYVSHTATTTCLDAKDKDCDGLGDQLEAELQTCPCIVGHAKDHGSCSSSPHCSVTHNARDTDGDGVPDSWEVFGRTFTDSQTQWTYHVEMSRYGANPRHKDVFVEVDWAIGHAPSSAMVQTTHIVALAEAFATGTSQHLANPNGNPGVRFHFDVDGLSNTLLTSGSSYGSWGGSGGVPGGSFPSGILYSTAVQTGMDPSRKGIFRYIFIDNRYPISHGTIGYGIGLRGSASSTLIHEMGHMLGLGHGGGTTTNCKPNYKSVMNYASNYNYDFENYRHVFSRNEFPDLQMTALKEDVASLSTTPLSPTVLSDWLSWLDLSFGYFVDFGNGYVNWNRSATVSGQVVTPMFEPTLSIQFPIVQENQCNSITFNKNLEKILTLDNDPNNPNFPVSNNNSTSGLGPGLVVHDGKLYLFYKEKNSAKLAYRTRNQSGGWNVPVLTSETIDSTPVAVKFSITPPSSTTQERIILFYTKIVQVTVNGQPEERAEIHMSYLNGTSLVVEGKVTVRENIYLPTAGSKDAPPSVLVKNNELQLYYRDSSKKLYRRRMGSNLTWLPLVTTLPGNVQVDDEEMKLNGNNPFVTDIPPVFTEYAGNVHVFYKINGKLTRALQCKTSLSQCGSYASDPTVWVLDKDYNISVTSDELLSLSYLSSSNSHYLFHNKKNGNSQMFSMFISREGSLEFFNTQANHGLRHLTLEFGLEYSFTTSTPTSDIVKKFASVPWNGGIHVVIFSYNKLQQGSSVTQEYFPNGSLILSDVLKDWNDWELMSQRMCKGLLADPSTYGLYGPGNVCQL